MSHCDDYTSFTKQNSESYKSPQLGKISEVDFDRHKGTVSYSSCFQQTSLKIKKFYSKT